MSINTFVAKGIDKTVRDFALKHKLNICRDWNNDYMLIINGKIEDMAYQPTAHAAICMMKRHLRLRNSKPLHNKY